MKKYLAILLSVVLLLTSIISTSMFSVAAEETAGDEPLADNVKLPYWEDEFGNEVQYWPGMDAPSNFEPGFSFVENTTKLPLTSLMKYTMPEGVADATPGYKLSEEIRPEDYAGSIFYIEIPDFGVAKNQIAGADTPDDTSDDVYEETDQFRFAMHYYGYNYLRDTDDVDEDGDTTEYLYNEDGSIKTGNNGFFQYAGQDWFIRGVNDTEWRASGTKTFYGISLPSGWKGYVYIEFNGLHQNLYGGFTDDAVVNSIYLRQLRSTPNVLSNGNAYYGYMPEGASLVISEPIWIKGHYANGASFIKNENPDLVIDGVAYNLNTGKADNVAFPSVGNLSGAIISEYSSTGIYTGTGGAGLSNGTRTPIPSVSSLTTTDSCRVDNFRNYSAVTEGSQNVVAYTFPENATLPDAGFLVYAVLPGVEGQHQLFSNRYHADGEYFNCAQATSVMNWYTLEKGTKTWAEHTVQQSAYTLDFDDADPETGKSSDWEGWIYIPRDYWRGTTTNTATELLSLNMFSYRTSYGNDSYSNTSITVPITFSAMTAVKNFDPAMTIVVGDNNRVVDLVSGELIDTRYYSAKEFSGKLDLINNGDANLLNLNLLPLKAVPVQGLVASSSTATGGDLKASAKNVNSACAITGMPALHISGELQAVASRRQALQFDFPNVRAGDIDGFMFYVKTGNKPVSIGINAATTVTLVEGGTATNYNNAYGYTSVLPLLAKGSSTWTATKSATPINGVSQIPANFEGYLYLPKFADMIETNPTITTIGKKEIYPDETLIWRLNFYMAVVDDGDETTTDDKNIGEFSFIPFTVEKGTWTKDYAGLAFVNGSEVAQNMFDGSFAVPNDMNKDMRVNLLDLVKAKGAQKAAEFEAFREAYLNTYFNDAEYSVLSAAFSVDSLAYDPEDALTVLSANPDRGYRSEMFVQFASKPLTIAETPDYTLNIGGVAYPVSVTGNTIRGARGSINPDNVDTDYNIYNKDMTPYGVGSGGAVHTVPVSAARAYAVEKGLAHSTEAELISAAVKMVDNYMQFDYRPYTYGSEEAGMTNIDVAELKRPVYAHEDEFATLEGAASGSNYGYYKMAKTHTYDGDGNITEIRLLVNHGRRTIFASDSVEEWESRWNTMFKTIYKIGQGYTTEVTFADGTKKTVPVSNTLFNAYVQFTEFAHKDTIPEDVLEALDYFFKTCEKFGAKANFRPAYNADYTENAYLNQNVQTYKDFRLHVASQCADEETMIAHIKQMAPVIAANKTAIHNISSGWIGFGGEMASVYQYPAVSYKNVITALLDYHCIPNGLYFSSRSSSYVTDVAYGVDADAAVNHKGNRDRNFGLSADKAWADKYLKWCGFNNDAFFGEQNYEGWGSGEYYDVGNASYAYDTANGAYTPNDGELYTNGSHVFNIRIENGKYVWTGFDDVETGTNPVQYNDTDNEIPTPMEAIRELAHHRYTDFSQWHGFLDAGAPDVMTFWMDHNAEWVFEGDVDNVATNGGQFNATERAQLLNQAITPALLEANGILYDPAYFDNVNSVNAYEFIRDHLGYRIVADKVTTSYDKRRDDKLTVSVDLKNYGFSAAFNMRASLALMDADGNLLEEIEVGDPSTWYSLAPDYYTVERNRSAQKDVLTHTVTAEFTPPANGGTYQVALRLYNSNYTPARLANNVDVTFDGFNMLGQFNLINLEGATPYFKDTLKVMSYNIRCLRGGDSGADTDPLTTAETATTIANFRSLLSKERPDVMIVCENRMYFDGTATGDTGTKNVYEMLFKEYFPYAYSLTTGASAPRIYSKYELSNPEYIVVDYGDASVGRRPLAAKIEVSGKEIYIVACHPEAGAEVYESKRVPYFEAVANWAKDKQNVIIAGDMNTDSADFKAELDLFSEAGFELGNFGDFGTLQTYRFGQSQSDKYLDNILSKGLDIKNFYVGTETYSDHLPIYAELSLK